MVAMVKGGTTKMEQQNKEQVERIQTKVVYTILMSTFSL